MKNILSLIIAVGLLFSGCTLPLPQNPTTVKPDAPAVNELTPTAEKPEEKPLNNKLDLSNQGLTKVPEYVFSRTSLEELDISGNRLTGAIQAEIRHLGNLKVLDASDNLMTGVPAEVGQLSNLEVLDLSNNRLSGLPYELGNLENLKILDISGNDYSTLDLGIITEALPANVEIIK